MVEYSAADVLLGRSRTRRRILALLAERPSERRHLRGIARAVGTSAGTASRELRRLESAGLVIRTREGAQVYHQANVDSPSLEPVRDLLRETRIEEYGKDLRRSTDIASDLSLDHGVSVTCMLVPQAAWETGDRPFIRAVAMDAIIASSDLLTNTRS